MMPYIAWGNDRQDAAASGPAFARGLLRLAEFLRGSTPRIPATISSIWWLIVAGLTGGNQSDF